MARLFTNDPQANFARISIPIEKSETQADGSILVWGKATDATLDRDQQIIDPDFARKSLRAWFESGANVRVMHSSNLYPAGRGVELVSADDGEWLTSRIVEPTAVKLVSEGVLQAYSVGIARPQVARDSVAKMGRVVGGETVEVSLVDRPANPSCGVMLAKGAGGDDPMLEFTSELLGEYDQALNKAVTIDVGGQRYTPTDLAAALIKVGKAKGKPSADEEDDDKGKGKPSAEEAAEDESDDKSKAKGKGKGKSSSPWKSDKAVETADVVKSGGRDCSKCGKSYHYDSAAKHCGECGTALPKGKPVTKSADNDVEIGLEHLKDAIRDLIGDQARDADAPIHPADHVVSADLADLSADADRALADQRTDMAQDKQFGYKTAESDLGKAEHLDLTDGRPTFTPADGVPYGLRRLHDATCAAYGWASVKDAHPGLEKSSFAELLKAAPNLLYGQLAAALAQDAGAGAGAEKVADLAKAYEAAVAVGAPGDMDLAQARSDLHRAFKSANPDAPTLTPMNTGGSGNTPSPSQWRRPYLSAGRAPMSSTGQRPRIPNPTHTVRPDQFRRGLIEDGHESDSPGNTGASRPATPSRTVPRVESTPAPGEKGVDAELTKGDLVGMMSALHDHIAGVYPHMCSMGMGDSRYAPRTNTDLDSQPLAGMGSMDMNADSAPTPVYAAATPDLIKAAGPDLLKAAVAELVTEQVETRLASQAEKYETEIAKMRTRLDEMAAQPDPNQSVYRGMAGLEQILPALTKSAQEPPAGAKAQQVERVARWLDSPDPVQREAARASLTKLIQQ